VGEIIGKTGLSSEIAELEEKIKEICIISANLIWFYREIRVFLAGKTLKSAPLSANYVLNGINN
jgi:hypothetical protein